MSVESKNEINQSDVNYIQQSEIDSCELHFVEKETQTFQETYHNVGIQMSPPSKKSNSLQTKNTINCKSSESQCDYHHYLCNKQLKHEEIYQKLLKQLNEDDCLKKLSLLLDQHEQTEKFVKLFHALSSNKLKLTNISWKAALDMGYLSMCTLTTNIIYDKEWLEFCQVLYHVFGGGVMNTLCGHAHFSHVTSGKCVKRVFKPYEGEFNFPVPSVPTLKKIDIGYSLDIPVGIIQQSLDLVEEHTREGDEFILSFDGKLISPGCKDKETGDCNMWGREGPPNIRKALKLLENNLKVAQQIDSDMKERSIENHCSFLEHLLYRTSCRLQCLCQRITRIFLSA